MQTPNYGRAIASRAARYSARYYRVIIAVFVAALLVLEAVHARHPFLQILTLVGILAYAAYVVVRLLLPDRWMPRYYTPRVQFWRAQAGILGLTLLLAAYAFQGDHTSLWILYLLAVMIVSEHCETPRLLLVVGEIGFLLIVLGYIESGGSLLAYLYLSTFLTTAFFRALAILLLAFLLHYMVRNVGARDTTIARYREMLDTLAANVRSLHDPQVARMLALNICQTSRNASCAALWALDTQAGQLALVSCLRVSGCNPDCPAAGDMACGFSIPLDDDRLPACVARTGKPHFASRADAPPRHLADAIATPRPFLPYARLELGVAIPDFRPHQPASLAVLCLAFDRPMTREEMKQEYDVVCEMARYLSPILYYASLLEQQQALQQLVQTVIHSLDRDYVLDTFLEQITRVFGFAFATVSLVDEEQGVIRSVAGRNVPAEWIEASVHSLDSEDIQADVIRTGNTEIFTGWDDRFDRDIWERFDHAGLVRVFMPIAVTDPVTGREKRIGTLEAGYRKGDRECITHEQLRLLKPFVDQAGIAIANAHLYEQMQATAEALTALHHGGQAIQSALWEHKRLLEEIGRSAEQVLGADIMCLYEYDESRQRAQLLFVSGDVRDEGVPSSRLGEGNILDAIIQERRPFYLVDSRREPLLMGDGEGEAHQRTFARRQGVVSFAGIPLLSGEDLLGIMCVNYRRRHLFLEQERHIIELFAQQAAIALKSARLHEQDHKLTIAQERTAFSRALHHSTSHDLFAIVLKARTALFHLDKREGPTAHELNDILDIAENANRQLGYMLSEFSAPDVCAQDFRHVLHEIAERIRRYYDIDVRYSGDGQADVSSDVHFALSCLAREALNNAICHSHCSNITISYSLSQTEVALEITDDGGGFDLGRALRKKDKIGLRSMQDYARSLGCALEVETSLGQGTRIAVCVPLQ
jgi:signal transduction histidine kinase